MPKEVAEATVELPRYGYCGKRMCGMFTGSTVCEPNGHKSFYTPEERQALLEDWGYAPSN
jgi:hypothetical protein